MDIKQYYTPPADEVFEEIKKAAIELWQEYDDTFGYVTEKTDKIKGLKNVRDNAWFIVAMFDDMNRSKLMSKVSKETADKIKDALYDTK